MFFFFKGVISAAQQSRFKAVEHSCASSHVIKDGLGLGRGFNYKSHTPLPADTLNQYPDSKTKKRTK